jgi:hypothetical protein
MGLIETRTAMMCRILLPFRFAVTILEKDGCHCGCALGILRRVQRTLRSYGDDLLNGGYKEIAEALANAIEERISRTMDGQFLEAAFALTQEGRGRMRHSMVGAIATDFSDAKQWDETLLFDSHYASLFQGENKKFLQPMVDSSSADRRRVEAEDIITGELLIGDEDYPDKGVGNGIPPDQGPYMNALVVLQELAQGLKISAEKIGKQFTAWIYNAILLEPIKQQYEAPSAEFWRTLSEIPDWKELSLLARIIFTAPSSEAVCERNFSRRKWLTERTSPGTKPDLMEARVQMKF